MTKNRPPVTRRMVTTRLTGRLSLLPSPNTGKCLSILRMGTFSMKAMAAPRIKGQTMCISPAATSTRRL